jgi:hypothetical protein
MPKLLDEEDELYGYAIYNVHRGQFLKPLGTHTTATFRDKEEMLRFMAQQVRQHQRNDDPSISHLRIVRVHLDNDLDDEAYKFFEQLRDDGYFEDEAREDFREDVESMALEQIDLD